MIIKCTLHELPNKMGSEEGILSLTIDIGDIKMDTSSHCTKMSFRAMLYTVVIRQHQVDAHTPAVPNYRLHSSVNHDAMRKMNN